MVHADGEAVAAALDRLLELALVWQAPGGLRALSGVAEGLTGGVAGGVSGLHPVSAEAPTADDVARRLGELSAPARAMLDHVDENGGQATAGSARHTVLPEDAASPAEELLARRLLVPRGGGVVQVPGEVGLALRGGRTTREPVDARTRRRHLGARPGDGGPGRGRGRVRGGTPRRAAARPLGHRAARRAAQRRARGARAQGDGRPAARRRADRRAAGRGDRRVRAARDRDRRRTATRSGSRPTRSTPGSRATWRTGGRPWSARGWRRAGCPAWSAYATRPARPRTRWLPSCRACSRRSAAGWRSSVLAELPPGEVLATGTGTPSVVARVAWLRPRRPRSRADQVVWALAEAASLGVTGLGGLSTAGRSLLAGEEAKAAGTLAPLLPEPVDHVLIQADLTAVAPGPLESAARPPAAAGRRHRVAGRGHGLPVHGRVGPPGPGRRLVGGGGARVRVVGVANAGAAAADLPRRRHRPHVRHGPGRSGGGVPAGRRRDGVERAAAPSEGGSARVAPDRPDRAGDVDPDRRTAAAAAGARGGAGGRGRRRHRAHRPPGPAAGPRAARPAWRERALGARECARRAGRDRDPGRRPGGLVPALGAGARR